MPKNTDELNAAAKLADNLDAVELQSAVSDSVTPLPTPPVKPNWPAWKNTRWVKNGVWQGEWPKHPRIVDRLRAWSLIPTIKGAPHLFNLHNMPKEDRAAVLRWLNEGDRKKRLRKELEEEEYTNDFINSK